MKKAVLLSNTAQTALTRSPTVKNAPTLPLQRRLHAWLQTLCVVRKAGAG